MQKREYLDLTTEKGNRFYFRTESLMPVYAELEEFLEFITTMNDLHFAKKMLFSHELKANNQVEGYSDDLELIEDIIKKKTDNIKDEEKRARILNLYRGYQFILRNRVMDEKHLKRLYNVLSDGLLDSYDITHMGQNYREAPVYILDGGKLTGILDEGVNYQIIDNLIAKYFEFINNVSLGNSKTDEYIKSQIMHFYFVYIHPYFDVNGRTSRTMALWHLLNKGAYPYIIFNRGIGFAGSSYDRIIREAKGTCDITYFLRFMLETVKLELEKESVMQTIASNTHYKLSGIDYQTMLYLLSMNGAKTVGDFVHFYNNLNDKKKSKDIFEEMLLPLIEADILEVVKYSKKMLGDNFPNMFLEFNSSLVPEEEEKHLKRLKTFQSSKK